MQHELPGFVCILRFGFGAASLMQVFAHLAVIQAPVAASAVLRLVEGDVRAAQQLGCLG